MSQKEHSQFDRKFFSSENRVSYIGTGSIGGKAHGLELIDKILNSEEFDRNNFPQIDVNIPVLTVLRTDVFDKFMKSNDLFEIAYSDIPDDRISHAFQNAALPFEVLGDLRALISEVHIPLAIRSSSMLEDAMFEPFAGIYGTKMTPNNQPDTDTRFNKLVEAIKYVYSSTYFKAAKDYIRATKHSIEEEKMAVIIQEVVGVKHKDRFYPELSGVARSYNFYPMGRAKPDEGVINLALGLGKTIVDGGISWAYSPEYPKVDPPFGSVGDMLRNTQLDFWSVNMGKPPSYNPILETEYMVKGDLITAESDGSLKHLVSTVDSNSGRLIIGTGGKGSRVLTFAPLLVFDNIPLNDLVVHLLELCEKALEAPVEIEFAMTFSKTKDGNSIHRFGFLQSRPMVVSNEKIDVRLEDFESENVLVASENVLGNGVIDSIKDIVFVIPEKFKSKDTQKIVSELELVNKKLVKDNRSYLLIGFGRWGSSDPWLGIPVNWGQVSGARAIVEAMLENMNVDLSQGSHFFHNLTSFNVSYFSVPYYSKLKIDWEWISKQSIEQETNFVKHVKLKSPLNIKADGRSSRGLIYKT
ncbi:PEP/pyruvate-binding domain-containing protein [Candidatus Neomarinimicrobiota bacterium]